MERHIREAKMAHLRLRWHNPPLRCVLHVSTSLRTGAASPRVNARSAAVPPPAAEDFIWTNAEFELPFPSYVEGFEFG